MSIASRYMKKSLLLSSEIFSGFVGKAQLIEEDSVGKDHFSRNEVPNQ